ncbi:hypothetical protein BMF94_4948 [Rhodotorula taiwanensis]|uniref:RNA helicase n=1 Tax=Rhodotorula taiwanensis TaxID=741276 RepID=A0A2S5B5H8_9BASI|nr:hypothetical protein BMF94_4948 [Rhodotorula taiwanensis]
MPVKMRFGSEEPAAGLAAAPAAAAAKATLAPHAAADDTASTSKASIATPTKRALNGGSMPNGKANGHENGSGKKKRKLVVFDEEAEQEAADKRAGIQTNGVGPRKRAQMDPEQRKKRLAEAQRLKPQREALPVYAGREAILRGIRENDTVVVLAETGSGKTTQIPQFLIRSDIPRASPRVVCTQPRRVAAISLAQRVAAETGCVLGTTVGYTVRFDDRSSPKTRLKYATDGTLLAEMLSDRDLDAYDVVVLDEAHERSLRTDMLMGFLKDIQKRRKAKFAEFKAKGKQVANGNAGDDDDAQTKQPREPSELKIVVMSATIDAKRFSEFFDSAPVLYVSGRQHKVTIKYVDEPQDDYVDASIKTIVQIHQHYPPGSILVFLPGQDEIEGMVASLRAYLPDIEKNLAKKGQITIAPLFAKLPAAEQAKAFVPAGPNERKVIIATNIAETSVTIPGVRFVIDSGMAKEKRYHAGTGIDSLATEPISQSSAKQRAGRAGRESDGWCFRLYTETAYQHMEKRSQPEIQRVSLSFALLHLKAAGQEDVYNFSYMDAPSVTSIQGALHRLHGLGALGEKSRITPLGRQMAQLPLDPIFSRVLLEAFRQGCPREVIDLVSLLGVKDQLIINTSATREQANEARQKFTHRSGDHLFLINILRAYEELDGTDEKKAWCKDNYISYKAMQLALDSRKQLRERAERLDLGDWEDTLNDEPEPIIASLVAGLFANAATKQPDDSYRNMMTKQVVTIHPSSTVFSKKPLGIIYDELALTTKTYARGVSIVDPRLLPRQAPGVFNALRKQL